MKRRGGGRWRFLIMALTVAAIGRELRKPASERTWNGRLAGVVPYDFRPPTIGRVREAYWAPDDDRILKPHAFGVGWGPNLGRLARILQGNS